MDKAARKHLRKLQKLQTRLNNCSIEFERMMQLPEGQHGEEFCRKCALIVNLSMDETLQLPEAGYIVNKYRAALSEPLDEIHYFNFE